MTKCILNNNSFYVLKNCTFFAKAPAVPDSCLPIGMQKDEIETKLVPMQPGKRLYIYNCVRQIYNL